MNNDALREYAFQLIIALGVISLFGDIVYEGARGVNGQYLQLLGANAVWVGFIIGLGELLGYMLRLASGFFADKTRSYWLFTTVGYGLLISIPLIAMTDEWQVVAILIILERAGKGIRSPARDTIASHASKQIGSGYAFGIAEFIDQIGAIVGPLIFSFILIRVSNGSSNVGAYQTGFAIMWLPYVLLLLTLWFAYTRFKHSEQLEISVKQKSNEESKLPKIFWLYTIFVFVTTAGFTQFALIGFHLKKHSVLNDAYIPFLYAVAIGGIDAVVGLVIGKLYDKAKGKNDNQNKGLLFLVIIPIVFAFIPIFIFSKSLLFIIAGTVFYGIGLGLQEVIMKAAVADLTPITKRSTAYGIFNIVMGLAFFIGGTVAGFLYDYSIKLVIVVMVAIELIAIPIFMIMRREIK